MFPTIQLAQLRGAVVPKPALLADTLLSLEVELAIGRTIRETLPSILVQLSTI